MLCPVCTIPLAMGDRQGVEINYCPTCRGVWIERGGIDKIIDRSSAHSSANRPTKADDQDDQRHGDPERRRRKSPFSEFFD